jgi:hypothetical protein
MTTPKPKKDSPTDSDAEQTDNTGFFRRVRRVLNPEPKPMHPTEEAEIVIMEDVPDGDEQTRL